MRNKSNTNEPGAPLEFDKLVANRTGRVADKIAGRSKISPFRTSIMNSELQQSIQSIKADLRRIIATSDACDTAEDRLTSMFEIANEDISALLPRQNIPQSGTTRRALVRSIFAFVESMMFAMKQQILEAPLGFTDGELALLREESYELSDNGEARIKTARLTLKSNLKFTFSSWARVTSTECKLDLSGSGWRDFQAALKVRDRLMHPKQPTDLAVTDQEIESATAAYFWFYGAYTTSLSQVVIASIRHLKATGQWRENPSENDSSCNGQHNVL